MAVAVMCSCCLACRYTGTQICGDPERQAFTIFLTNRVYPSSDNDQMHFYRQEFNNAVKDVLDSR